MIRNKKKINKLKNNYKNFEIEKDCGKYIYIANQNFDKKLEIFTKLFKP